jgi:BirA family transcriptional regulator, biotin operon repressor / biotin---[acetyl-CoA-carboxylase] ligase
MVRFGTSGRTSMGSLDEHTVAEAARVAGYQGPVSFVEVTGSTNADLVSRARTGAEEWTAVVAGEQRAGRGRLGRSWIAPPRSSLLISVLLRPRMSPDRVPAISLAVAVCLAEACRSATGVDVRCKWPNDLIVGDRKMGGILLESSIGQEHVDFVVVGAGVNVAQSSADFPQELRGAATSVSLEGGRPDILALLIGYLGGLKARYHPRTGFDDEVLDDYRERCVTLGRKVRAVTLGGAEVTGTAVGIGSSGELLVETPAGSERVAFGEIEHLR